MKSVADRLAASGAAGGPRLVPGRHGLGHARGPPALDGRSTDPTYPYILNSLLVAEGRPPAQATHPGTPLQVLGAVVLRVAHGLSGSALDLQRHVLTDPE